jgi:predicted HicB family RNase H-like nuclease
MSDEKKSTYTGYTEARKKANEKYLKESVEDIRIRVPKGDKAKVQEHAATMGESTNAFVVRAITEAMKRDRQKQE